MVDAVLDVITTPRIAAERRAEQVARLYETPWPSLVVEVEVEVE